MIDERSDTKIGIFNGNLDTYSGSVKYNAFMALMNEQQLSVNEDWVISIPHAQSSEEGGYLALEVSDDISVVGIDDHLWSA